MGIDRPGVRRPLRAGGPVTAVVTTRSDRRGLAPQAVAAVRAAFGRRTDVRVVSHRAGDDGAGRFVGAVPWGAEETFDGLASALDAALAEPVGATVLVLDSAVIAGPRALRRLVRTHRAEVRQALVLGPDGGLRAGARLIRPGALPWTDDRRPVGPATVFGADQPVLAFPGTLLAGRRPVPPLSDERMLLTAWTHELAPDGVTVVDVGPVSRGADADRCIDARTVDTLSGWRAEPADPAGRHGVAAARAVPPWGARPPVPRDTGRLPGPRRWAIKIAAPTGEDGDSWGDVSFAADLADALRRLGEDVRVDRRDDHTRPDDRDDDVTLVVRGLDRVPPNPATTNLLWVISHPGAVDDTELRSFDAVFAASRPWAEAAAVRTGVRVEPLLQATDPTVFRPGEPGVAATGGVVFVGSTRGVPRPIVLAAVELRADLTVHGPGWHGVIPDGYVAGDRLSRTEAAAAYRSARVVLNDHWPDMAEHGFLSNRVFDVLASGGVVVTDAVAGLAESLGGARGAAVPNLAVAPDLRTLRTLLDPHRAWPDEDHRRAVAARIAAEHSFDARARRLVEVADARLSVRGRAGA